MPLEKLPLESFLDEIRKISEEERELREQGWRFFQAVSAITTYKQNKNETTYTPKNPSLALEEAKMQFEPLGYKVTKAYYWSGEENPNALWIYRKK